jgi:hypothetical protein
MSYTIRTDRHGGDTDIADAVIVLVGCGGTGGFLAEAVCRLLLDRPAELYLVDHDRVEAKNLRRQAFQDGDVGKYKAQVLAERLSRRYHRAIGYDVRPYDDGAHGRVWRRTRSRLPLVIGCVDGAGGRNAIRRSMVDHDPTAWRDGESAPVWWLDVGNGRNDGQVLLGNLADPRSLPRSFRLGAQQCLGLPAPSLQRKDLLVAAPVPKPAPDCAERVLARDQGPTINQVMAAVAASFVEKLLAGTCAWMAAYVNMDDGVVSRVAADPHYVGELTGVHVNTLVYRYDLERAEAAAKVASDFRPTDVFAPGTLGSAIIARDQGDAIAHHLAEGAAQDALAGR